MRNLESCDIVYLPLTADNRIFAYFFVIIKQFQSHL